MDTQDPDFQRPMLEEIGNRPSFRADPKLTQMRVASRRSAVPKVYGEVPADMYHQPILLQSPEQCYKSCLLGDRPHHYEIHFVFGVELDTRPRNIIQNCCRTLKPGVIRMFEVWGKGLELRACMRTPQDESMNDGNSPGDCFWIEYFICFAKLRNI